MASFLLHNRCSKMQIFILKGPQGTRAVNFSQYPEEDNWKEEKSSLLYEFLARRSPHGHRQTQGEKGWMNIFLKKRVRKFRKL